MNNKTSLIAIALNKIKTILEINSIPSEMLIRAKLIRVDQGLQVRSWKTTREMETKHRLGVELVRFKIITNLRGIRTGCLLSMRFKL